MTLTTFEGDAVVAALAATLPIMGIAIQRRFSREDATRDRIATQAAQRSLRQIELSRSTASSLIDECSEIRAQLQGIPTDEDVTTEALHQAFRRLDRLRPRLPDKQSRELLDDCACMIWYAQYLAGEGDAKNLASALADYVTDIATALLEEAARTPEQPSWYPDYLVAYQEIKRPQPAETPSTSPTPP